MNTPSVLTLSGYGYLRRCYEEDRQFCISLDALTPLFHEQAKGDHVSLEMEVADERLCQRLKALMPVVTAGHVVLLKFSADYTNFIQVYPGQTSEDPKHLVILEARLNDFQVSVEPNREIKASQGEGAKPLAMLSFDYPAMFSTEDLFQLQTELLAQKVSQVTTQTLEPWALEAFGVRHEVRWSHQALMQQFATLMQGLDSIHTELRQLQVNQKSRESQSLKARLKMAGSLMARAVATLVSVRMH